MDSARIEALVAQIEALPDPIARARARELVAAVLDMHGEALARLVSMLGPDDILRAAADPKVSALLVLHELHPLSLEARVRAAVCGIEKELRGLGAWPVDLRIDGARVHVQARCESRHAAALSRRIEEAILSAAPDAEPLVDAGALIDPARLSEGPR